MHVQDRIARDIEKIRRQRGRDAPPNREEMIAGNVSHQ